ncbi:MAG TPA: fatty acid desaturase [Dongiaceae bacterium]|nr:fatty acid desaturase [Dongiaceae bacterium]
MHRSLHASRYRRVNLALLVAMASLTIGGLIVLPLVLLPQDPRWGWLLVPIALLTNFFWALHHEAIHGGFHGDRQRNMLAGRVMAVLLGSSFHVLRFGHLMHHRYNRNPIDRPDTYDPAVTPRLRARLTFLGNLVFGLYLAELAVPAACWLPRPLIRGIVDQVYRGEDPALVAIRLAAHRLFLDPRRLRIIRTDALLAWSLIALSAAAFGPHWPMLLAFLVARGVLISVFDNVYHFATPIDRPDYARNLSLPGPLRLLILNMNLHRVHHARPALPWWALPAQFRASRDQYDAPLLRTALAQFGGPVATSQLPPIDR